MACQSSRVICGILCIVISIQRGVCPMIEGCFCVASAVALEGPRSVFEPCCRFGGVETQTIVEWSMRTADLTLTGNVIDVKGSNHMFICKLGVRYQHPPAIGSKRDSTNLNERLVYKCLHGLAPGYLSDQCIPASTFAGRDNMRSSTRLDRLLYVPRTKTKTLGP